MTPPKPARQKGSTLLMVLFIVVMMSAAALAMTEALNGSIQAARGADASATRLSREADAATLAAAVLNQAPKDVPPPIGQSFDFDLGSEQVSVAFTDAGNCFNLNEPLPNDATAGLNEAAFSVFQALLRDAGFSEADAETHAARYGDWIDADSQTRSGGEEDSGYLGRALPHRAANGRMHSVTEWRVLVPDDETVYTRLRPFVCAGKPGEASRVNINTLDETRAALLSAYAMGALSLQDAEAILRARPDGGWQSVDAFLQQLTGLAPTAKAYPLPRLTVETPRIGVSVRSVAGKQVKRVHFVCARTAAQVYACQRQLDGAAP